MIETGLSTMSQGHPYLVRPIARLLLGRTVLFVLVPGLLLLLAILRRRGLCGVVVGRLRRGLCSVLTVGGCGLLVTSSAVGGGGRCGRALTEASAIVRLRRRCGGLALRCRTSGIGRGLLRLLHGGLRVNLGRMSSREKSGG